MNKATFVIPLGAGSAWEYGDNMDVNSELRYMLRSLDKYCQFDFDIILYTTEKVEWLDCKQVIVKREYPQEVFKHFGYVEKHYENYYDVINKLRKAIDDDDVPEEFFFIYDDMILLHDLYINDLKLRYCGGEHKNNPKFYDNPRNKWMRTVHASLQTCKSNSRPLYLYETHLPRHFHKSKLKNMFSKFRPEDNKIPYAISTLYYNMYYDKPDINYYENNDVKVGFYGQVAKDAPDMYKSQSNQEIKDAVKNKTWINYNNAGLTGTLKLWIEKTYQDKSKFEKDDV